MFWALFPEVLHFLPKSTDALLGMRWQHWQHKWADSVQPFLETLPSGDETFKKKTLNLIQEKKKTLNFNSILFFTYPAYFLNSQITIRWEGNASLWLFGEITNICFETGDMMFWVIEDWSFWGTIQIKIGRSHLTTNRSIHYPLQEHTTLQSAYFKMKTVIDNTENTVLCYHNWYFVVILS